MVFPTKKNTILTCTCPLPSFDKIVRLSRVNIDDMRPSKISGTEVMLLTHVTAAVRPRMRSLKSCMNALTFLLQADKQKPHPSVYDQSALERTHSMLTSCITAAVHAASSTLQMDW